MNNLATLPLGLEGINSAVSRLDGIVTRTPLLSSETLDAAVGSQVLLKAESLQRGGAFKLRGAFNQIATADPSRRVHGVVAGSSGNFGCAVAIAAAHFAVPATVVLPHDAPSVKRAALHALGARVIEYDRYTDDRSEVVQATAHAQSALVLESSDSWSLIAGHATAMAEILEDSDGVDAVVAPVGGGGLLSGCALLARLVAPRIRVIAVELETQQRIRPALAAGRPVPVPVRPTLADGLALPKIGERNYAVISRCIDDVLVVDEDDIRTAMAVCFELLRLVVEPAGAAALAAVLRYRETFAGQRVAVILSGGNVGLERFMRAMADMSSVDLHEMRPPLTTNDTC